MRLKFLLKTHNIIEISPPLDPSGITVKTMLALLTEIIAQIKKT